MSQAVAAYIRAAQEEIARLSTRVKELEYALEDIDASCGRHPLMVGFVHSGPTVKELQERLDEIRATARTAISTQHSGQPQVKSADPSEGEAVAEGAGTNG